MRGKGILVPFKLLQLQTARTEGRVKEGKRQQRVQGCGGVGARGVKDKQENSNGFLPPLFCLWLGQSRLALDGGLQQG